MFSRTAFSLSSIFTEYDGGGVGDNTTDGSLLQAASNDAVRGGSRLTLGGRSAIWQIQCRKIDDEAHSAKSFALSHNSLWANWVMNRPGTQ
jgi:hypothetical protein